MHADAGAQRNAEVAIGICSDCRLLLRAAASVFLPGRLAATASKKSKPAVQRSNDSAFGTGAGTGGRRRGGGEQGTAHK